jgi:hypothetical protein
MIESKNLNNIILDTPQELIDDTIAKVHKILDEHFPDHIEYGNGQFTIPHGSTQIMVLVRPFIEDDTCVECFSQVVTGANITPGLMKFLLRKNAEIHLGAFGLLFDDTIIFSHSITGKNMDASELFATLNSVAVIADYYDDIIVKMAGGKKAIDIQNIDENHVDAK